MPSPNVVTKKELRRERWVWTRYIAGDAGPRDSTTQHILLTLSLFMNSGGGSAFPSVPKISRATRRCERTVRKHLRDAEEAGWITITQRRRRGQFNFDSNLYELSVPAHLQGDFARWVDEEGQWSSKGERQELDDGGPPLGKWPGGLSKGSDTLSVAQKMVSSIDPGAVKKTSIKARDDGAGNGEVA
jgi:hypothetical protein